MMLKNILTRLGLRPAPVPPRRVRSAGTKGAVGGGVALLPLAYLAYRNRGRIRHFLQSLRARFTNRGETPMSPYAY